jgi:hypothetical protein
VPPPFPPHVARDVGESRKLYNIVKAQDRQGMLGIVQGEKALSRLEHAAGEHKDPYDRPDAFLRPYLPGEPNPNVGGSAQGQGSLTQADVTPGAEPTKKYAAEQPGQEGEKT